MLYLCILFLGIVLDQLSKTYAQTYLYNAPSVDVLKGVLRLTYAQNTGASFSLFNEHTDFLIVFSAVSVIVLLGFLFRLHRKNHCFYLDLSLLLVISGAVGNLIDRIRLGYVIDFFEFTFVKFAVFNVADVLITTGCALFILSLLFNKRLRL